jgi:hypothetical protein
VVSWPAVKLRDVAAILFNLDMKKQQLNSLVGTPGLGLVRNFAKFCTSLRKISNI